MIIKQAMRRAVLAWLPLAAAMTFIASQPLNMDVVPPEHGAAVEAAPSKGTPAWFVIKHDCWTGEAPADMQGKFPGHVVVTTPDGVTKIGSVRLVDEALQQMFNGVDHGLTIHGFCR